MRNYGFLRCITGIIGSTIAMIIGLIFFVDGIKTATIEELYIGIPIILVAILGIIICAIMLKKSK